MSRSKLLVFGRLEGVAADSLAELRERFEVAEAENLRDGLRLLQDGAYEAVLLLGRDAATPGSLLDAGGILSYLPDGIVLLDPELNVLWANGRLKELANRPHDSLVGESFYDAFGTPEILGPDFCPFHTALGSGEPSKSTLRVGEKQYYEVHARPILADNDELPLFLAVIVRDISEEVLQRQKLNAIYQAGLELGDLAPHELLDMTVSERIELLKSRILHYTQDLLEFDTVEIRLLDKPSRRLDPLLAVGMQSDAEARTLYAEPTGNGVTGFVAATGKSYLCEDTEQDPLYLPGAAGARSSLTVPLVFHDEILGTFNVESPRVGAFSENDLQFLELFSREIAVSLNTLELLVAEKLTTATESTETILREVAGPVDEILNDAAWILEKYIGHEPTVCDRLNRVLKDARDIKQLIQRVGEDMQSKGPRGAVPLRPERPKLKDKRILVVDSDESVRRAAHALLGRFGCEVETAHDGDEALLMARSFHYDAVLVDIRLPDMNGYDCFVKLREIHEHLEVILMTGFGYDPAHCIVKARQAGLRAVLYKPFRLDQLLSEVEKAVSPPDDPQPHGETHAT
ncbi:MAG: response regulator [Planctomycetota bacterium]|nr:response regulator [Planctomycetaceae bacterium]MDQ3332250.1 response regulator [Planctomycetota bacterium]